MNIYQISSTLRNFFLNFIEIIAIIPMIPFMLLILTCEYIKD